VESPVHYRVDDVRRLIAARMPGYEVRSVDLLGSGLDNTAYDANGELIVRFRAMGDEASPAEAITAEARLLEHVADLSPVAVPRPLFVAAGAGCLAYFKLGGVPLLDVAEPRRSRYGLSIAPALGRLLTAMHNAPVDRMAALVAADDDSLADWQRDAAALYAGVAAELPPARRPRVEAFLRAAPPPDAARAVFSHNDLGIEHVLVDAAARDADLRDADLRDAYLRDADGVTVTGVIDWSDAAIVDPAADFGRILRDLGDAPFDLVLRNYRTDGDDVAALRRRAEFYARCKVLEDLAYGIAEGSAAYSEKALAATEWLFPR
jgi:aminoglycoside phosphotransferase (APT) family kinase protein